MLNLQEHHCKGTFQQASSTLDVEVSSNLQTLTVSLGQSFIRDVEDVFRRLGFGLSGNADRFTVSVPRRR